MKFSRPKVLRLLEILRLYRPPMPIKADSKEVPNPEDSEFKSQRTVKNSTEAESENVLKVPQKDQGTKTKDGNIEPVPGVPPPVPGVASSDFMNRNYRYRDDMHHFCGAANDRQITLPLFKSNTTFINNSNVLCKI
jgi:hypothetical protein